MSQVRYLLELVKHFLLVNEDVLERSAQALRGMTYQIISLPNLIWSFLQSPLRGVYPSITLVDVFLHVPHIVIFEAIFAFICSSFILPLQRLAVYFRTGTEVLLRVCEQVMGTGANEIRSADFWICEGELGMAG